MQKLIEDLNRFFGTQDTNWELRDTGKKGHNYSIFFKGTHYATIRGKAKAIAMITALKGVNTLS